MAPRDPRVPVPQCCWFCGAVQGVTVAPEPVASPAGWEVVEEVDLLEKSGGPANLNFTPFQLHSWKIKSRR